EHFSKNVLPELRRVHGYLGAAVFLRRLEREVEIVVETNWDSLESIRNFAGPDLEAAVVAPVAAAMLTGFDRRALHSEIAFTDRGSAPLPLSWSSALRSACNPARSRGFEILRAFRSANSACSGRIPRARAACQPFVTPFTSLASINLRYIQAIAPSICKGSSP